MIMVICDGKIYRYNGPRSKEALVAFLAGGFRSVDAEPVPAH